MLTLQSLGLEEPARVLLVDPPWRYHVWAPSGSHVKDRERGITPYPTMTQAELLALPVGDLAAKDAALFMWATMPCLPDALELMAAWGFTFKTAAFTWLKTNKDGSPRMGLGRYTRGNAELCLLGIRGRMPVAAHNVPQVILAPLRGHSRKPDEQYERIMRLYPSGPYAEIFARYPQPGWTGWGNEYPSLTAGADASPLGRINPLAS